MESIRIKANAKINLAIDVLGLFENGYHQVEMVMHQVALHDSVLIRWYEGDEDFNIVLKTNRRYLPVDERNLAYKAAKLMAEEYAGGRKGTLKIDIKKEIPVAAGLAGGSSNGAAVLHGLNRMWKCGLSLEELMEKGRALGSDVPFCIMAQARTNRCLGRKITEDPLAASCALATYDGTLLKPLKPVKSVVVLSKPPVSVSTKEVYQGIDGVEITSHPQIKELIEGIEEENSEKVIKNMGNVLEFYTLKKYNCIVDTIHKSRKCKGVKRALMSGSGPTVICMIDSLENGEAVFSIMKGINKETYLTETTL